MTTKITKAIFPVAGLGTRFLPATKSIPKEIMTLVDRPLIQYAIDEAREAGITDFIFVTARGKSALEDYFDRSPELEEKLQSAGKTDLLKELRRTDMESGAIAYIRQREARGLGHAVWCARRLIGDEPFAVLLPDDVITGPRGCLAQMVDAYCETGGNMVATMQVPMSKTENYGIVDVGAENGRLVSIKGMVEKPKVADAPSDLAVIGRYILRPEIMDSLSKFHQGAGGEIQLTDAIAEQIDNGCGVHGYKFEGDRYDCGSKAGFLQATVAFALEREDLRDDFRAFLDRVTGLYHAAE